MRVVATRHPSCPRPRGCRHGTRGVILTRETDGSPKADAGENDVHRFLGQQEEQTGEKSTQISGRPAGLVDTTAVPEDDMIQRSHLHGKRWGNDVERTRNEG